jgi:hypothetical protein
MNRFLFVTVVIIKVKTAFGQTITETIKMHNLSAVKLKEVAYLFMQLNDCLYIHF